MPVYILTTVNLALTGADYGIGRCFSYRSTQTHGRWSLSLNDKSEWRFSFKLS